MADLMPDSNAMPLIALQDVGKRFASGLQALAGVSLNVNAAEFVSLVGPSGCGKSTVLRLVAALDEPSAGTVRSPRRGKDGAIAFVFQEPTLMPWTSVFDNVWLPLRLQGHKRKEAAPLVRATLAGVGLAEFENAYPAQLSGGMKMRVSIARALIVRPKVLLMDEPFAALDDITRQKLNADLLRCWHGQSMAAIFVTHTVGEAVFLSQRVVVMSARPGRVLREITIDEPYPRTSAFRHSVAYNDACRRIEATLDQGAEQAIATST